MVELEVGGGIVDGDACVLRQGDGQERHGREQQRRALGVPDPGSSARSMPESESEPVARTRTTRHRNSAGSANEAKVTSRAAPMPSKDEPVSSAARAVKKRPRPSR